MIDISSYTSVPVKGARGSLNMTVRPGHVFFGKSVVLALRRPYFASLRYDADGTFILYGCNEDEEGAFKFASAKARYVRVKTRKLYELVLSLTSKRPQGYVFHGTVDQLGSGAPVIVFKLDK